MFAETKKPSPAGKGDHTDVWWMRRTESVLHKRYVYMAFNKKEKFRPEGRNFHLNFSLYTYHISLPEVGSHAAMSLSQSFPADW